MEPTEPIDHPSVSRRLWHRFPFRVAVCGVAALAVLGLGTAASGLGWPTDASAAATTSTTAPPAPAEEESEFDIFEYLDELAATWPELSEDESDASDGDEESGVPGFDTDTGTDSEGWTFWTPIIADVPVSLEHPANWTVAETNDPSPKVELFSPDGDTAGVSLYTKYLDGRSEREFAEDMREEIAAMLPGQWEEVRFDAADAFDRSGFLLEGVSTMTGSAIRWRLFMVPADGEMLVVLAQELVAGDSAVTALVDEVLSTITIDAAL